MSTDEVKTGVRFLSKAERERLRLLEEADEKRRKEKALEVVEIRKSNYILQKTVAEADARRRAVAEEAASERRRREAEKKRKEDADRRRAEESNKKKGRVLYHEDDVDPNLPEEVRKQKEREREQEQIKDYYLGNKRDKKKIQKPSEKFRNIFQFDWDVNDDTTRGDYNPLYHSKHEPQLLFGRGFRAGVDVREQRRANIFYDVLAEKRKEKVNELTKGERGNGDGDTVDFDVAELSVTKLTLPLSEIAQRRQTAYDVDADNERHWSKKTLEEMTTRDWRIFREDFNIAIKGGRVPNPIRNWQESNLPQDILDAVKDAGYTTPSPIQMQAIPIALSMRDLIGLAETGSGKTAAFMLPMLAYVSKLPPLTYETSQSGPYGLVLAPSRELALQIREEAKKFCGTIKSVAIVGGRNAETQAFELRSGAEIVIGTPGRVKDCLEKAYTVLIQCNYVVLDEADRMIDMGFEEVVNWILNQIPSTNMKSEELDAAEREELEAQAGYRMFRVTQMFSATMPASVERMAKAYLRQPAIIQIGTPGEGKKAIEQIVEITTESKKKSKIVQVLESLGSSRVIVFVNQKKNVDALVRILNKAGFGAVAFHGGKAQDVREDVLEQFKNGEADILVATDVAGRGIDVEGVPLVINYDMPKDIETYTHRIGRTGRAGKKGCAVSFLIEEDSPLFYDLRLFLQSTNNVVPHELASHAASKQRQPAAEPVKGIFPKPAPSFGQYQRF